jgi:hypothetical protein
MSLTEFKKLIGPLTETLTEEQIEWLYNAEYTFADAIFEWWLRKRNAPKQIDDDPRKEDNASNLS